MGTRARANGKKRVTCYRQPAVSEAVKLAAEVSTLRLANERLGHEVEALRATVETYDHVAEARAASTEVAAVEASLRRMADELTAAVERATAGMQASVADAIRLGDEYGQVAKSALSSARSVRSDARKAVDLVLVAQSVERGQLERALVENGHLAVMLDEVVTSEGLAPAWMLAEFEKLTKQPRGETLNKAKIRYVEKVITWSLNQRARAAGRAPVVGEQAVERVASEPVAVVESVSSPVVEPITEPVQVDQPVA